MRHTILALTAALMMGGCVSVSAPVAEASHSTTSPDRHSIYSSTDSFAVVESRLRAAIASRPLTLFTVVDHGEGARAADMPIGQSKLFIVGNPDVGTPFMMADPSMGLDLPLKILIHDTPSGGTHIAYSHPGEAAKRHGIYDDVMDQVEMIHMTMGEILSEAAGSSMRKHSHHHD